MNNSLKIEIFEEEEGYTVMVDGQTLLECLSVEEIEDLTLGEIEELRLKFL